MSEEDLIQMAHEAGFPFAGIAMTDVLQRFAALVAAECAQLADQHEEGPSAGPAIRARFPMPSFPR